SGPWAGKVLAGAENSGLIYAIATNGFYTNYALGILTEDIDIIPANQNLFVVDINTFNAHPVPPVGKIRAAPAWVFKDMVGDLLFTEEGTSPGGPDAYLMRVHWNGTDWDVTQLFSAFEHFEHATFCPMGMSNILDVPS